MRGFKWGGFPDLDLSFQDPFSSFVVLFVAFPISAGILLLCPFPLFRPIKAPTRKVSQGACDTIGTLPRKNGKPPVWKPPGLPSPNLGALNSEERTCRQRNSKFYFGHREVRV